jgi:hypothetical protein
MVSVITATAIENSFEFMDLSGNVISYKRISLN